MAHFTEDEFAGDYTDEEMSFLSSSGKTPNETNPVLEAFTAPQGREEGSNGNSWNDGDSPSPPAVGIEGEQNDLTGRSDSLFSPNVNQDFDATSGSGLDDDVEGLEDHGDYEDFSADPQEQQTGLDYDPRQQFDNNFEEYYDARDFLPEDNLRSDVPFDFGQSAKYRNFDDAKRGFEEKDRYIGQLQNELQAATENGDSLGQQIMSLQAEMSATKNVFMQGKSEDEVDRMYASQLLPEHLRGIDRSTLDVSLEDFIPDWNTFYDKQKASNGPDRKLFDDQDEFRRAMWSFDDEVRADFDKKRTRGERKYRERLTEVATLRNELSSAEATAVAQIRSQRVADIERSRIAQESQVRRINEAAARLDREVTPATMGITNKEGELKLRETFQKSIEVFQNGESVNRTLSDIMVLVEAQFGTEPVRLMLEGIKSNIVGPTPNGKPKPRRRPVRRNAPRPRDLSKGGRGGQQRSVAPSASLADEYREAGLLGGRHQRS